MLQNTRGSTLGREKAHFRGETSMKYKSEKFEYVNENLFYRFEVSREEESVGNGFQKTRKWKNRGNIPHL